MSQADVGQRSEHRLQCTQTSSSLSMIRPVWGCEIETYNAWETFDVGALCRDSICDLFVLVQPLVHAHLAAAQGHAARHSHTLRLARAELVDRDGGLVPMFHGPDDVLRAERRISAEEHVRQGGLEGPPVHLRNIP